VAGSRQAIKTPPPIDLPADALQEAASNQNIITLDDDEPATLRVLLSYFYSFVYDDSSRQLTQSLSAFAVHVYAIADKYDVKPLQDLATQKLKNVCNPVTNVEDYIAAVDAVDELTSPKDGTLWGIIIPKTIANIGFLLGTTRAKELILGTEALNVALLKRLGRANTGHNDDEDARDDEEQDEYGSSGYVPFSTGGLSFGGGRRLGSG